MTRPYPPTQENLGEKPMAEAEKPTIQEAIEWGRTLFFLHDNTIALRNRLVEAAELWLRFGTLSEKFIKSLDAEKERRIEELGAQIEAQKEMKREAYQAAIEETEDAEKLRTQLAEKERELERLRGMLDGLLKESDPPEPTDAEVEKVGERLYLGHTTSSGLMKKAFRVLYGDEKIRWYSVARHVIERGYRPEEE